MPDELRAEKSFPSKLYSSLKNKSEFDRVYKRGFKKHNPFFSLYVLDLKSFNRVSQRSQAFSKEQQSLRHSHTAFCNSSDKDTKALFLLGLSVSKKVGNATKRNLVKRRFRSLVTRHVALCKGFALVFVPRGDCCHLDFWTLEKHFLEMMVSIKNYANKALKDFKKGTTNSYAK
ncbi:ribonuclease P protein component [Helicobacter cetorum]|uniref:Ribonuclease P protein component n=1 Tax=Helicobacter cetorum (strain ATCC BAA-540 / CCUG 52418 / MIT 99-5656) TaxID=1163745 RepID=I0EQH4_HELCM|nr:ribonuclease P protein component [Helicobacter cetorum]AFI05193.1 ribonuclease P protein component [Helicobacter cetorum MIT 99-5656]